MSRIGPLSEASRRFQLPLEGQPVLVNQSPSNRTTLAALPLELLDRIEGLPSQAGADPARRAAAIRLNLRLHGTGRAEDAPHVRDGLLSGDQAASIVRLCGAPVTPAKLANLELLCAHSSVSALFLGGADLQLRDEHLRCLQLCPQLEILNVNNSGIGDSGAVILAGCPKLNCLFAQQNDIGQAGATALAGARALRMLNISVNPLNDAAGVALAASQSLRDSTSHSII